MKNMAKGLFSTTKHIMNQIQTYQYQLSIKVNNRRQQPPVLP